MESLATLPYLHLILAGLVYLKPALAAVLVFVGSKMLLMDVYKVPALLSLAVIVGILGVATAASLLRRGEQLERVHGQQEPRHPAPQLDTGTALD